MKDKKRLVDICKASCTLPILCPITYVDGIPMVDGGVCDAIPIRRAIADGFSKNVIILTRNKGYRKEEKDFYLPGFIYNKYPAIREQLRLRYRRYNEILDYIDQLEAEGKAFVIRPQSPIKVGRTGSDTKKLEFHIVLISFYIFRENIEPRCFGSHAHHHILNMNAFDNKIGPVEDLSQNKLDPFRKIFKKTIHIHVVEQRKIFDDL